MPTRPSPEEQKEPQGPTPREEKHDREALRLARKARRQAHRRRELLDAAREVILRCGLDFTIERLAAAADLAKPTVYYYFDTKEAVIGALALELLRVEVDALGRAIVDARGGLEALVALVRARLDLYRGDPDGFRILYLWAPALGIADALRQSEMLPLQEVVTHALASALTRAQERGELDPAADPQGLATLTWAATQGLLSMSLGSGDPEASPYPLDTLGDQLCRLLLRASAG